MLCDGLKHKYQVLSVNMFLCYQKPLPPKKGHDVFRKTKTKNIYFLRIDSMNLMKFCLKNLNKI